MPVRMAASRWVRSRKLWQCLRQPRSACSPWSTRPCPGRNATDGNALCPLTVPPRHSARAGMAEADSRRPHLGTSLRLAGTLAGAASGHFQRNAAFPLASRSRASFATVNELFRTSRMPQKQFVPRLSGTTRVLAADTQSLITCCPYWSLPCPVNEGEL